MTQEQLANAVHVPRNTVSTREALNGRFSAACYMLGNHVVSIGEGAFGGLSQAAEIHMTSSVRMIAPSAFQNSNVTLYAPPGSYALDFAQQNGLTGVAE